MTLLKLVAAVGLILGTGALAWSAEFATKQEAVAMVKKAAALVKQEGEKAYASFDAKGGYVDRDLYALVYRLDGKVLAHGANGKLIGKNMGDAHAVDGKYDIKDRVALAAKQSEFRQDYKFINPS